jgi:transcriptional regulator with XRE-family HTH domain
LLADARGRSGLRQAELARRAGLPRSVLNVYERGRREPGGDVLINILEAAGFELRLASAPPVNPERAGRILGQVLDLAEALPGKRRGRLGYPPFPRRAA